MRNETKTTKRAETSPERSAYLENTTENHSKFYEIMITRTGSTYTVTAYWGRISDKEDAHESNQVKYTGTDAGTADNEMQKLIHKKELKGYEIAGVQAY